MADLKLVDLPEALATSPSTAATAPEVREKIAKILPSQSQIKGARPAFEEKAVKVPYGDILVVTYKESPNQLTVTSRKLSVQFKKDKVEKEDVSKVTVMGAKDVRLYCSVGLRFVNRSHTDFILHDITGIRTGVGSHEEIYFLYGKAVFFLDQPNYTVKVWAPEIGYDLQKGGFIYFCVPEPRPTSPYNWL